MRSLHLLGCTLLAALSIHSCSLSDEDESDPDGLVPEVRELLSQPILDGLNDLGQPIYTGMNPPDVAGTYLVSPLILMGVTISGDSVPIGSNLGALTVTFAAAADDLTMETTYSVSNGTTATPTYSVVQGSGCEFSVFSKFDYTNTAGSPWSILRVTSGCVVEDGILDVVTSYVMLADDDELFDGRWLPGQGRSHSDWDGLAERQ